MGRLVATSVVVLVIAMASLAFVPFTEHYTRPHTRPALWRTERFRRTNVVATMMWAAIAAVAAGAHVAAPLIDRPSAYTVLNWVVPIALVLLGTHGARRLWGSAFDDEDELMLDHQPLWDLTVEMNSSSSLVDDI